MNNVHVELHLIQNFAPSCLNRDDTNAPKDCEFGGVRRARLSSQSIKKAVRDAFKHDPAISTGYRTKLFYDRLVQRLVDDGYDPEKAADKSGEFIKLYLSKLDSKNQERHRTSVILNLGDNELEYIESIIRESLDDDKKLKKEKTVTREIQRMVKAADIALFGRMMAENADLNVHAACQVAHALSTHRVNMDFDFYTAVDDLNPEGETGASMMGTTGFNSACFYRYSLVNWGILMENLNDDTDLASTVLKGFLKGSVLAIPTGKQNSFAAQNLPLFGLIVIRKNGTPCSLANAFIDPTRANGNDLAAASVAALTGFHDKYKQVYGDSDIVGEALFNLTDDGSLHSLASADAGSVEAAIDTSLETLKSNLED